MDSAYDPFSLANTHLRKADQQRWHRYLSKRQILRSQLGFNCVTTSRPKACQGCVHYHGVSYGYSRANRTALICGFHPFGWEGDGCPDWAGTL
ncbi:MAG TPA: hypothetical protein V6C78_22975 [Crinalium sp.]